MQKLYELHEQLHLHEPKYGTEVEYGSWFNGEIRLCACGKAFCVHSPETTTTWRALAQDAINDRRMQLNKVDMSKILKCAPKEVVDAFLSHYKIDVV